MAGRRARSVGRDSRRCIGWDTFHAVRPTLCTALLVLAAGPALAGAPQQRVRQTVDGVSATVNDPQLQGSSNERERRERVAKVMRESFDFRGMARESLGAHWASLAPEQRDRFIGLVAKLFERSYDRLVLRFDPAVPRMVAA